jgi:two-component system cell cycle sensor histidine kinase/response regulator CckA
VEEALSVLRASFPTAIEISVSCVEPLPPVRADAAQMKQVVTGLCINAAEAMAGGGKLSVAVRAEPGAGRVALEVADTGVGMDAGVMTRIFEPFFSTKEAGRGMGLAAIRGIVENHGGEIRVDSRRAEGTTFTVLLPESPVPREEKSAPAAPRTGAGCVLLADDEPDVRAVVRAMLESLGYSVIEARDGREAVDRFRERHGEIDLVLLDLMMPRLTGEAALAEMRRIVPGVAAILASGYDDGGRICRIVEGGFGGFLQKPFRRQDLGEKVSEVLGSRGGSGTE